jgi:endonuclease/exonuclease/phosphatase family metal-dependent hydrolase
MAEFTPAQWSAIFTRLDASPQDLGMPKRRSGSVVVASWNIRKFGSLTDSKGNASRSDGAWQLIETFCRACDLVAIQEVMDSLECLRHLRERLGKDYRLVVSDIAGGVPGRSGARERLAFVYNAKRIEHTELASDITFERSAIFAELYDHRDDFFAAFGTRTAELDEWNMKNAERAAQGKRKLPKPAFVLPRFVQFIRSPHTASFLVKAKGAAAPYEFSAVNAHLLYGDKDKQRHERELEFKALLAWLLDRAREKDRNYAPNLMLFGDLNLDFEKTDVRRRAIEKFIVDINSKQLKGVPAKTNFPFLDQHPAQPGVFRTNARRNQTYDQIALFATDRRLPPPQLNGLAGTLGANHYDYGMFDFVRLFFDVHPNIAALPARQRYRNFEYDVSDHMPIWIRLPIPHHGQDVHAWS